MRSIRLASEISRKVGNIFWERLCEYTNRHFGGLATQTILSRIGPGNSKMTYVWEQYLFHYIAEGGFIFLTMADDSAGRYARIEFIPSVSWC